MARPRRIASLREASLPSAEESVPLREHEEAKASSPPRKPLHLRHRRTLVAFAGGGVAALATPPTDLYPAMFVGLGMLAWAIDDAAAAGKGAFRGMGLGLAWGTAGQLIGMRFIPSVITLFTDLGLALALLAHLLLSVAQSLHWALGMGLAIVVRRRLGAPLALGFAAGVMLALSLPSIFLWSPAGLLSPWPQLVQAAALVGERGVSALMAAASALGAVAFRHALREGFGRRFAWSAGGGLAIIAALAAHGFAVMAAIDDEAPRARIALIHAGIDPRERWDGRNWPRILAVLKQQTAAAEGAGVDLSIWPEAAYPYPIPHGATHAPRGARGILGGAVRGPILFGFIATDKPVKRSDGSYETNSFNAATIIEEGGALQPSYDKMELLWFGEMVPLGEELPWLRRLFQRSGGLIPGRELRGLSLAGREGPALRMGVLNCYEDTLPGLGRRVFSTVTPNLLVNVTNDAWFVGTEEPLLHARLAAMRSIELRRDMVRAVNLGVSGWIDAWGRVKLERDDPSPGYLLVEPALRDEPATVYARWGDLPIWVVLWGGIGVAYWSCRRTARLGAAATK